jgi:hypothetical protein
MAALFPARAGKRALAAFALAAGVAAGPAAADEADTLALEVKATYLYKLPPFITWPAEAFPSPTSPFTLCVVGKDPFGDVLDKAVAGKRLMERPVAVLRLDAAAPNSSCQLMYIAAAPEAARYDLDAIAGSPVLTVTDSGGGPKGIVNFVVRDNHVRFEIDQAQATRNRLEISSKLLSVAASVTPK